MLIYKSGLFDKFHKCKNYNCEIIRNQESCTYSVFEQKPLHRNIMVRYYGQNNIDINGRFYVSLPKILFKMFFINRHFWFMQVACICEEKVYKLPLGNIGRNHSICLGKFCHPLVDFNDNNDNNDNPATHKFIINHFWSSTFNLEVWDNVPFYRVQIADPRIWQEKTKNDINWIPTSLDLELSSTYSNYNDFIGVCS